MAGALGLLAGGLAIAAPAIARPAHGGVDGPLGTLHRGAYLCEEAGNALGEAGIHQPGEDFTVLHDSAYRTDTGEGYYLLTGTLLRFTSGPRKGERFRRVSDGFLRQLAPDGSEGTLRCIRRVANNQQSPRKP